MMGESDDIVIAELLLEPSAEPRVKLAELTAGRNVTPGGGVAEGLVGRDGSYAALPYGSMH